MLHHLNDVIKTVDPDYPLGTREFGERSKYIFAHWSELYQYSEIYQSRQSTTSIGVTHRMGVGECLFVTYWLLMYSCISCKLFSFAIVVK